MSRATILLACSFLLATACVSFSPGALAWTCEGNDTLLSYTYYINNATTPSPLSDVKGGDWVTAHLVNSPDCAGTKLCFASYAADSTFKLENQTLYDSDCANVQGTADLSIKVPPCFFQIDLVTGDVIEHFDTENKVTYHDEGRFIDGAQGGEACETTDVPFFPSTPALAMGALGAVAIVGFVLFRRK